MRVLLPAAPDPVRDDGSDELAVLTELELPVVRGRVLLADDERMIRSLLTRRLEEQGYQVVAVADGVQALEVMAGDDEDFDILVTDVMMPHMDGVRLAGEVRGLRPELPILFVTGYAKAGLLDDPGELEPFDVLPKPFAIEDLLVKMSTLVSRPDLDDSRPTAP